MRIIGGRHRGRTLEAPPGALVRPTGDRVRESLFNILEHGGFAEAGSPFAGRPVLDAFAGTGALGLEALSRGAAHVWFIEREPAARRVLDANIRALGETAHATILAGDALAPPRSVTPCRLVFLDPPYGRDLGAPALAALAGRGWFEPAALAVLELGSTEDFAPPGGFTVEAERRYGVARLVFLRHHAV
jgi:16S rRNA (guanine966-N2)-methyltransferase